MKNCFNCAHKKTDLWNHDFSDDKAHTCLKGNNEILLKFRKSVEGKFREEIENNPDYELDCHELSEHQKVMNNFLDRSHEILDELKKIVDNK